MRIALFSDVHGNLTALETVLASISTQNFDHLVFAGDLCFYGPRPAECLRLVRERRIMGVDGNTDEWILGLGAAPDRFKTLIEWTAEQLLDDEKLWLGSLPFSVTINPTAEPRTGLHVVHANPRDVNQVIFPPEADQQNRYGEIRQTESDLGAILAGLEAGVLAYGHLHIPSTRVLGDQLLVNVSSVSLAGDDDPRAKYSILSWSGGQWTAEHVRIPYDTAPETAAFRRHRPPGWEESVALLEGYNMQP